MSAPLELDLSRALRSLRSWRRADIARAVAAYATGRVELFDYHDGARHVARFASVELALEAIAGTVRWTRIAPRECEKWLSRKRGAQAGGRSRSAAARY